MRLLSLLLIPSVTLVAQAPTREDLVQRFNTELPAVNQLLKEMKPQEALEKARKLIPTTRPAVDGTSLKTIGESVDNARGLSALYGLQAKTASSCGRWEEAVEVQAQRVKALHDTLVDLTKAQGAISDQWNKVSKESAAYVAANITKKRDLESTLKALGDDVAAYNSKKRTFDAKGIEELKARIANAPQQEQELADINTALPIHKQNLANAPKVMKILDENRKEAEGLVKAAEEAEAKARKAIADQNDEITKFNATQVIKKIKVLGRKNWVNAVMRDHDNITKQGSPEEQMSILNRLMVLDPGNVSVQEALDNLKAGKDAFMKEPSKPGKKSGAKKP
jgi:hypothetical protein